MLAINTNWDFALTIFYSPTKRGPVRKNTSPKHSLYLSISMTETSMQVLYLPLKEFWNTMSLSLNSILSPTRPLSTDVPLSFPNPTTLHHPRRLLTMASKE
jgi:hypothetical protein